MDTIAVTVHATDPITLAGVTSHLGADARLTVTTGEPPADVTVIVLVAERVGWAVLATMRRWNELLGKPIVLVVNDLSDTDLLTIVECGVVAVLPRASASGERIVGAVLTAATGGGVMPANLLGELLAHVGRLQREVLSPNGLNNAGLTPREVTVLRLMANGLDTAEIAEELSYSDRTVKNVISAFTSRLNLRNRAHAVAYALRAGVI